MDTILALEAILERLERCPMNLARVELDMFCNALQNDVHLNSSLQDLVLRHRETLGERPNEIACKGGSSQHLNLEFANSAALRAATGYMVCQALLQVESDWNRCGKKVVALGGVYARYQGVHNPVQADAIKVFSEVILRPLVSYLRGAQETEDRVVLLLSRYKQRSEWFPDEKLIEAAQGDKVEQVEKRLKKDFLRYLFDNGVVFSIESQPPSGGSEADVLAVLPDMRPLPVEAKVFDGKSRNRVYVSQGLDQAADYGRRFNSAHACYIVYNIAENTELHLPGTVTSSNVIRKSIAGVDILAIAANVRITLPSSQASKLQYVTIQHPSQ